MSKHTIGHSLLKELSHKDIVRFALFCVNQVKHKWTARNYDENTKVIKAVELWLEDEVVLYDISLYAANTDRIDSIVQYLAWTTIIHNSKDKYDYINSPAYYASRVAEIVSLNLPDSVAYLEQINYYNELRYIDDILEKIVLEGIEKPFR
jgi:hypothetical protein